MNKGITDSKGIIFRNIRHKKRIYIIEFTMVAVVSMILFGMLMVFSSMRNDQLHSTEIYFGKKHVTYDYADKVLTEEEKKEFDVQYFCRYYERSINAKQGQDSVFGILRTYEDIDDSIIYYDIEVSGNLPKDCNEVLVPQTVLNNTERAWEKGDSIVIGSEESGNKTYTISGFYTYKYSNGESYFAPMITMGQAGDTQYDSSDVIFSNEWNIITKSQRLADHLGISDYLVNTDRLQLFFQGQEVTTTLIIYLMMGIALMAVCYAMIRSIILMRLPQINKENAILRSFGTPKRKVYKIAITEAVIIGISGYFAGVIAYLILSFIILCISGVGSARILEMFCEGFFFSAGISIAFVVPALIVIMLVQFHKSYNNTVSELLSANECIKPKFKRKKGKKYKSPVKAYVFTSLWRNKWKTILSIVLFSAGIMFFVAFAGIRNDFANSFGSGSDVSTIYDARIAIRKDALTEEKSRELYEFVKGLDGIEKAKTNIVFVCNIPNVDSKLAPKEYINPYIVEDNRYERIYVEVYDEEQIKALNVVSGSCDIDESECILVNFAHVYDSSGNIDYGGKKEISDLKVGDYIETVDFFTVNEYVYDMIQNNGYDSELIGEKIAAEKEDASKHIKMEIKGIAYSDQFCMDNYFPVVIISENYYRKHMGDKTKLVSDIDIKLENGEPLSKISEKCREVRELGSIGYFDLNKETWEQTRTIQGLLYSIVAISVFAGLITVICTIMINWEISKKEYAVLKSVGATTKRVLYIVLAEKAIICLLSGVIGSGLGIGIERLAAIAFKGVPFRPPITEIIVSLLMMLLISLLATYIQGGSLKNIRIAEVMNKAE